MYFDAGAISFPGLGIESINPPQTLPFTIFGKEIYLYGIVIAFGFLLAILYVRKRAKEFGTNFDLITDAILFAVPLAIICARIYYVAFQWEHYKDDPISALYIWQGGIAIYGGVIGAILGLILFSKLRKQKLTPYLDLMALGLLIGQCIGRWGNFFNREAYGEIIYNHFFLRMGIEKIPGSGIFQYWHPTFLYESLWNFVGFFLLHFLSKKRKYDGQTFLQYLAWYGLGRVWIEGLRTDSLYLGGTGIRVSQLLAGASFIVAVGVMLYIRLFREPDGSKMLVNQAADNGQQAADNGEQATGDEEQATGDAPVGADAHIGPSASDAPVGADAHDPSAPNEPAGADAHIDPPASDDPVGSDALIAPVIAAGDDAAAEQLPEATDEAEKPEEA